MIVILAGLSRWRRSTFTPRILGAFIPGQGSDHHIDAAANQFGIEIAMPVRINFLEKSVDHLEANFRVRHFASAEFQRHLHLHVFTKKANGMLNLNAQIMRINFGAELDLFDLRGVLVLLRFLVPFRLFVAEFPEIHYSTHGWRGVGRNLYQVDAARSREI